jgi:hypothetical protein
MKDIIFYLLVLQAVTFTSALTINEVMSNPVGDDGGREWIEIYNETENPVDISGLSLSVKGGQPISAIHVSGGASIAPYGYGIVASTVSGATKFGQDYPNYNGSLFRAQVSLVNTGSTSLEVRLQGVTVDTLSSYVAAKEGSTYSKINGLFTTGTPTPGEENKSVPAVLDDAVTITTSPTPGTQVTLPQASAPSSDVVIYLPFDKTVVAGAPSSFSVYSLTHAGKPLDSMTYIWSFGDGGQRMGSSTIYRYFYPGRYVAQVEGTSGLVTGTGRMLVRVVAPDIAISEVGTGKYGPYVDITNPSAYDLDISDWRLVLGQDMFPFPKNTLIKTGVTRFSGIAMGFASTTVGTTTVVKILFPTMEEVVRMEREEKSVEVNKAIGIVEKYTKREMLPPSKAFPKKVSVTSVKKDKQATESTLSTTSLSTSYAKKKDTRIASFVRSFFSK